MHNFDAKVTLATTLTQFETNMGIPSSMILSRVNTTVGFTWKVEFMKDLETTKWVNFIHLRSTMHKVPVRCSTNSFFGPGQSL